MSKPPVHLLSVKQKRRLLIVSLLRAFVASTLVVTLYYVLPLDNVVGNEVGIALAAGLAVLATVGTYQVRAILRAPYPGIRAVQALATTAPLFLVLFAATYYLLERSTADSFNVSSMTRTDAIYFTVTVFATVGFGDIAPVSQFARGLVTVQMILDLLILGFGVRVFIGAVQIARAKDPNLGTVAAEIEHAEETNPDAG